MIYHVFANRSNIGDWLSARGIQSQLPGVPLRELLCDEEFVDHTLEQLGDANEHDLVVIGGGGLFVDYFLPFWSGFERISQRVPFCIWGVGLCDFKARQRRLPEKLLDAIVRRSRLCIVRDQLTYDALSDACKLSPSVPCPSLLVLQRPIQKGNALLHAVHYEATGQRVYESLCELIRDFAQRSGREYLETNNEIQADSVRSLTAALKLYDHADLVVTSRLHGCIIGLAKGCRVVAISGDRKVESFMHAAGLGAWSSEMGDFAGLRRLLQRSEQQQPATTFLQRARDANVAAGKRVAEIIASKAVERVGSLP